MPSTSSMKQPKYCCSGGGCGLVVVAVVVVCCTTVCRLMCAEPGMLHSAYGVSLLVLACAA